MKTYGWQGHCGENLAKCLKMESWRRQVRVIVSAKSKAAAARIVGAKGPHQLFNMSETGNQIEKELAEAKPGAVFVSNLDSPKTTAQWVEYNREEHGLLV